MLASPAMQQHFARALPESVDIKRWLRVGMTVVRMNPGLADCESTSIIGGMMQAAHLGLEIGPMNQAYLVPFRDRRTRTKVAVFVVGYMGMVELALRSGRITSVVGRAVFEGDDFDYEYGLTDHLHHRRIGPYDPDAITHTYMVAKPKVGDPILVVANKDEIDAHEARSPSARSDRQSPWDTDRVPMSIKTSVRIARPWLPMSPELADAYDADERTARWTENMAPGEVIVDIPPTPSELLSGEGAPSDADTEGSSGDAEGAEERTPPPEVTPPAPDAPSAEYDDRKRRMTKAERDTLGDLARDLLTIVGANPGTRDLTRFEPATGQIIQALRIAQAMDTDATLTITQSADGPILERNGEQVESLDDLEGGTS
jgi:recombination protein RecT